ncbi:NTF2-like N-terminal transpeptidase domain-containing protein [Thermodesulfobium acidiphilum]|uniref:NTF2-like N-terminal transpeptidase domain-containing protein n=1 Tax=Thermodesulfobium acidiphilum TaxID=1794699 RepID=A0A2R4VZP7_THEAF|nr:NTF2-like N-terminal transpeptidase domain-containing protein [Thermodesulfobium acidiphilum]AWB10031.1 NTF2-like N-terminal transpeptidase domain-containing protein [Thermodesulfobium acidiphilum]PMP84941.1 MAG: hypothetical protein C0174_05910 [Thermodesulfobium narugense]
MRNLLLFLVISFVILLFQSSSFAGPESNPSLEGTVIFTHGTATDALKDYFSDWMKGDYDKMYQYLLKGDKKIISKDTFVSEFKKAEAGGLRLVSFKLSKAVFKTARGYAEINAKITFTENNQKFDIVKTITMYVEDNEWRLSSIPIYFPGSPSSMLPD